MKVKCEFCENEFDRYPSLIKGRIFCNNICKNEWQKYYFKGSNNPNYNKRWSTGKKEEWSNRVKQMFNDDPEYRYKSGCANRGKKFSDEIRQKMSIGHIGKPGTPHTVESKKKIGIKSKKKFTPEFKKKFKNTMIERGYWTPDDEKTDLQKYNELSNWVKRMYDYCDINDLKKLNEFGVWNCKTNKNGLVRDHKYSRLDGFKNGVFPELIRHPFNVQLLFISENTSKRSKSSISLDDLLYGILNYNSAWCEQKLCVDLINNYKKGERWTRKENVSDL